MYKSLLAGMALCFVFVTGGFVGQVQAGPFTYNGQVFDDGNNGNNAPGVDFSLIHDSTSTGGATLWDLNTTAMNFIVDHQVDGALTAGDTVSISGPQVINISGGGTFTITSLNLTISNSVGGMPTGYVDYQGNSLDGETRYLIGGSLDYHLQTASDDFTGTFTFQAAQLAGAFNGATFNAASSIFTAFMWGADSGNNIGIDIAMGGTQKGGGDAPAPAPLALIAAGLLGIGVMRRKQRAA